MEPVFKVFTVDNSIAIMLANEAANWKEISVFENMQEEGRIVGGINHVLELDRGQGMIWRYRYTSPMICCHYWEVTISGGQKMILKYCTNEEKVFILVKKRFVDQGYVSRWSSAIAVLKQPCDKCK